MTSSKSNVHYHSWFEQDEESRQTLADFNQSLLPCISPLSEICTSLYEAYQPFQQAEDILPFQCRRVIRALTVLCTHLDMCTCLLKDTSSLPLVLLALRYRLLDEFYRIEEQAYKLMSLINKYNQINRTSVSGTSQQYQAIDRLFTTLLQDVSNIPQKASFLVDEAKFQEKGLPHL